MLHLPTVQAQSDFKIKNSYIIGTFHIRGVTGGWAGWAIAHPDFDRIEGAAGQRWRAALLLAHPAFGSHLRP